MPPGVNRVDLMAEFFDSEGRLKEGVGHLYHPDPDTVLSAEQIVVKRSIMRPIAARWEAAEFLLDRGADVNGYASGFTPLHRTVLADQLEIAQLLLARGADPLLEDRRFDVPPYGWANFMNTSEALKELLREHHEAASGEAYADSSAAPPWMRRRNRGGSR